MKDCAVIVGIMLTSIVSVAMKFWLNSFIFGEKMKGSPSVLVI